jgi:hypothetical protein
MPSGLDAAEPLEPWTGLGELGRPNWRQADYRRTGPIILIPAHGPAACQLVPIGSQLAGTHAHLVTCARRSKKP